jgi:hypothetical protein
VFSIRWKLKLYIYIWGRGSLVGIATRYGLEGPRIVSQTGPGTHPTSYTMGTESFSGVKRPKRGAKHPPPSSAEGKGRVEIYLYSSSGLSWPVSWRNSPLPTSIQFRQTSVFRGLKEYGGILEDNLKTIKTFLLFFEWEGSNFELSAECSNVRITPLFQLPRERLTKKKKNYWM